MKLNWREKTELIALYEKLDGKSSVEGVNLSANFTERRKNRECSKNHKTKRKFFTEMDNPAKKFIEQKKAISMQIIIHYYYCFTF